MKYPVTIESIQEKITALNEKIDVLNKQRLGNLNKLESNKKEYEHAKTHTIISSVLTPVLFGFCVVCGISLPAGLGLFIPLLFLNSVGLCFSIASQNNISKELKEISKNIKQYEKQIKDLSNDKYIEEKRLETLKNQFTNIIEKLQNNEINQSKKQTQKGDTHEQSRNSRN